mgnify:CR=1 FL=1
MLNELNKKKVDKIDKKWLGNEKVRVNRDLFLEEIMKRCKKESVIIGKRIWKIENKKENLKVREIFDFENFEMKGIRKREVLFKKS